MFADNLLILMSDEKEGL